MAVIDNTLAAQVDTYNPATPLMQAAQIQQTQAAAQQAQFQQKQNQMGATVRGLQPYVGTPEFAGKWAEAADSLLQQGVLDPQTHQKWRNTPSPLLMKQIIAQTSDPTLEFHKSQADRQQANADRDFAFKVGVSQEKPTIHTVKDASGNESLVQVTPKGEVKKLDTGPTTPDNPFSYGKMNEGQSKDAGYANRMFRAEQVLRDPKVEAAAQSLTEVGKDKIPIAGNYLTSPEFQKFDQAKRDFLNAVLRRESGAAISSSEFENGYKQYFPQPGDSKEKIAEKRKNRQDTLASIAGGGGPSYKPPFTFDENGEMVPTGNAKQGVTPSKVADNKNADALNGARDAIKRGASKDAVIKRLRENGIDPAGL